MPRCEPSLYNSADSTSQLIAGACRSQKRRRCDLCDEGREGEATHSCGGCDGALLCHEHADSHPKKRLYSGHVVQKLCNSDESSRSLSSQNSNTGRCYFHGHNNVVTFCETCSVPICPECLSKGHKKHTMNTLSVADKERASVREMMKSSATLSGSADSVSLGGITSDITTTSEEMEKRRKEAGVAAAVVDDAFASFEIFCGRNGGSC